MTKNVKENNSSLVDMLNTEKEYEKEQSNQQKNTVVSKWNICYIRYHPEYSSFQSMIP